MESALGGPRTKGRSGHNEHVRSIEDGPSSAVPRTAVQSAFPLDGACERQPLKDRLCILSYGGGRAERPFVVGGYSRCARREDCAHAKCLGTWSPASPSTSRRMCDNYGRHVERARRAALEAVLDVPRISRAAVDCERLTSMRRPFAAALLSVEMK